MLPNKDMTWKITIETRDGQIETFETDRCVLEFQDFIEMYCKDILTSPMKRIIERWQE